MKRIIENKLNLVLIVGAVVVVLVGFLVYQRFFQKSASSVSEDVPEVDLAFDPEGAYALFVPRRDGNAAVLNLKRTSSYDSISYELAYTSTPDETVVKGNKISDEGDSQKSGSIDRGVIGKINTQDKKGEYEQEILFGTCSKNVCKYDKGVENGTLTLHIRKGNQAFRMITQWHLQQPEVALGVLTSGDSHFTYKTEPDSKDLSLIKYTIINDLTGAPKLPSDKTILGKVYALNTTSATDLPAGTITVELAENPPLESKIAKFDVSENKWIEYETKISGSKLTASGSGEGIFTVLTRKK